MKDSKKSITTYIFLLRNCFGVHVMSSVVKQLLISCHHLSNLNNRMKEHVLQKLLLLFIIDVDVEMSMQVFSLSISYDCCCSSTTSSSSSSCSSEGRRGGRRGRG